MGSIVHKVVNGQTYYYLREMARVDGKPKMISQRYLGKAADIEAAMDGAMGVPERTRHLGFGDIAAVWSMLVRRRSRDRLDQVRAHHTCCTVVDVACWSQRASGVRCCA